MIKLLKKRIAKPYAEILLGLGILEKNLENLNVNIKLFSENLKEQPLNDILKNREYSNIYKKSLLKSYYGDYEIKNFFLKFINILIKRSRISLINEIFQQYEELFLTYSKIENVDVITSLKLRPKDEALIFFQLKKHLKVNTLKITTRIKTDIFGGLVLKTSSKIIDLSLRKKLLQFAKQLEIKI